MKVAKSRILHLQTLIDRGACAEQVALFRKSFGKSVRVTSGLCRRVAGEFRWGWAALNLLSPSSQAEYDRVRAPAWVEFDRALAPAQAEYDRVRAAAWAEYNRVRVAAQAEYNRVRAPAWVEYDRALAPARAKSDRVRAAAWAEYDRVCAAAFAVAYICEHCRRS